MRVVPVPCLSDNYAYLVICESTGKAAVVDPSESEPIVKAVEREGVALCAIWNTHHHWDHTGGNKDLLEAFPHLEVIAHESDRGRIPGQTTSVTEGDQVTLGDELRARIIYNPGHTMGAISYHLEQHEAVFTGDTLFLAGCGRVFEGTFPMMSESLMKLASLPGSTRVYCGHEYTMSNLRFAQAVEPDNQAVRERMGRVATQYDRHEPSVPATMAEELATNPFLRLGEPSVHAAVSREARPEAPAEDDSPAAVFGALRTWKDNFRG